MNEEERAAIEAEVGDMVLTPREADVYLLGLKRGQELAIVQLRLERDDALALASDRRQRLEAALYAVQTMEHELAALRAKLNP
jgi:hypothetical protein